MRWGGRDKRGVVWKSIESKNSGERSTIGGEETKSTYSPVYLLYPVGDSFLKKTDGIKDIPRFVLGN